MRLFLSVAVVAAIFASVCEGQTVQAFFTARYSTVDCSGDLVPSVGFPDIHNVIGECLQQLGTFRSKRNDLVAENLVNISLYDSVDCSGIPASVAPLDLNQCFDTSFNSNSSSQTLLVDIDLLDYVGLLQFQFRDSGVDNTSCYPELLGQPAPFGDFGSTQHITGCVSTQSGQSIGTTRGTPGSFSAVANLYATSDCTGPAIADVTGTCPDPVLIPDFKYYFGNVIFRDPTASPTAPSSCLSGDMIVKTEKGDVFVKDLNIGDKVHVGSGKFEPIVWSTQHWTADSERGNDIVQAHYIGFEMESGSKVWLTKNHFAITTTGEKLASEVVVGDRFYVGKSFEKVLAIEQKMKLGVYNPQTPSQKIEVNNVVVSTRTKHSPPSALMGLIFQVLYLFQSTLPATIYNTAIDTLSKYTLEYALFGAPNILFVCTTVSVSVIGAAVVHGKSQKQA